MKVTCYFSKLVVSFTCQKMGPSYIDKHRLAVRSNSTQRFNLLLYQYMNNMLLLTLFTKSWKIQTCSLKILLLSSKLLLLLYYCYMLYYYTINIVYVKYYITSIQHILVILCQQEETWHCAFSKLLSYLFRTNFAGPKFTHLLRL